MLTQPAPAYIWGIMRDPRTWGLVVPYATAIVLVTIGVVNRFDGITETKWGVAAVGLLGAATLLSLLLRVCVLVPFQLGGGYPVVVGLIVACWFSGLLLLLQRDIEMRVAGEEPVKWYNDVSTYCFLTVAALAVLLIFNPSIIRVA